MNRNRGRGGDKALRQSKGELEPPQQQSVTIMQAISGPIPSPAVLAGYAQISPDLVNRIFTMAEKEQDARHAKDNRALEIANTRARRGQFCGLIVALAGMGVAAYCASHGAATGGTILGVVDLAALVTVFATGGRRRRRAPAAAPALPPQR